jgi:hypothetical protein
MGRHHLRWDVLQVAVPFMWKQILMLRRRTVPHQYHRILDVIKWQTDKDAKDNGKYAWYRSHTGGK